MKDTENNAKKRKYFVNDNCNLKVSHDYDKILN